MAHANDQILDSSATPARLVLGTRQTYSAVVSDLTPAIGATDIFTLSGSATKTVFVTAIEIIADATAVGIVDFYLYKRTAANTGGTSSSLAPTPHDSQNAAATAVAKQYSANPSALGAGTLWRGGHLALPAATATGYPQTPWLIDLNGHKGQPLVLRGASEFLAVNLAGEWTGTPAGLSVYINAEWIEI